MTQHSPEPDSCGIIDAMSQGSQGEYWFNTKTKQVDVGHQVSSKDLLGPYATRADAESALAKAAARTEAWDRDDAED